MPTYRKRLPVAIREWQRHRDDDIGEGKGWPLKET
jgi:hypothetical protein